MKRQLMTSVQIRERGLEALSRHLGTVGMVRFLQQSELGWGNYTEERHQWLDDPDLDAVAHRIQANTPNPKESTALD